MKSILAIDGNISHDSSVTLIHEGEIYAVECERLDRVKKSPGYEFRVERTPGGPQYQLFDEGNSGPAIRYCLGLAGIERVDTIIHTQRSRFLRFLELEQYLAPGGKLQQFPSHHLAHACSAFYYSDFTEAAVLVVDASGPEAGRKESLLQSQYFFDGEHIKPIRRTFATPEHQLGIGINYILHSLLIGKEEGSVMGLSSYGDPARYPQSMLCEVDAHIYIDPKRLPYFIPTSSHGATPATLYAHYGITEAEVQRAKRNIENSFLADIAARVQQDTEQAMIRLATQLHEETGCKNLCLAGGVALNSVANHKILEQTPFERIFVQPAAHDGGISLGLALFAHHHQDRAPRRPRRNVFLGRAYSDAEIEATLQQYAHAVTWQRHDDIVPVASELLAADRVIAWFQGRMEMGPRALGHRSVLAHPGTIATRDRVNDIKRREPWRPLAPAILAHALDDWFKMLNPNPYMLLVAGVTERTRRDAPAVVHVDGTARPQCVDELADPLFFRLIRAFEQRTGVPMLLNTSLNTKGEPLIEHPEQAIVFLVGSGVDALAIGSFIVRPRARQQLSIRVDRSKEPEAPIDTEACMAAIGRELRGLELKSLQFFKGEYQVQLDLDVPSRGLDLGLQVEQGRVTAIFNLRTNTRLDDKYRPLIQAFISAFERFLAPTS